MKAWKVGNEVGNVKNDTADLLLPDNVVEMPRPLTEEEIRRWEDNMDDLGVIDAMIERRERQLERKNKKNEPKQLDPNLSFDFSADPK
jgi:hypothetical protein